MFNDEIEIATSTNSYIFKIEIYDEKIILKNNKLYIELDKYYNGLYFPETKYLKSSEFDEIRYELEKLLIDN